MLPTGSRRILLIWHLVYFVAKDPKEKFRKSMFSFVLLSRPGTSRCIGECDQKHMRVVWVVLYASLNFRPHRNNIERALLEYTRSISVRSLLLIIFREYSAALHSLFSEQKA